MRIASFIALSAALAAAACGQSRAHGGGATVQRSYQVGAFQSIEVAGPYEVEVVTGRAPSVSASGPEKLIERLVVEVKGNRLLIHPRKEQGFNWSRSRGTAKVQVTAPMLRAAAIAGSGGISVDRISGDSFEGSIAGSGGLRVGSIEVKSLKLSIGGSGDATARSGRAGNAEYSIAGSGQINAQGVRAGTAAVSIAGSGSVNGQATGTANVSIMGSGDVSLSGGAKCSVSKMGSGEVRCS